MTQSWYCTVTFPSPPFPIKISLIWLYLSAVSRSWCILSSRIHSSNMSSSRSTEYCLMNKEPTIRNCRTIYRTIIPPWVWHYCFDTTPLVAVGWYPSPDCHPLVQWPNSFGSDGIHWIMRTRNTIRGKSIGRSFTLFTWSIISWSLWKGMNQVVRKILELWSLPPSLLIVYL